MGHLINNIEHFENFIENFENTLVKQESHDYFELQIVINFPKWVYYNCSKYYGKDDSN